MRYFFILNMYKAHTLTNKKYFVVLLDTKATVLIIITLFPIYVKNDPFPTFHLSTSPWPVVKYKHYSFIEKYIILNMTEASVTVEKAMSAACHK